MRDPKKNTTFVFYCYEKESVDLKIRLRYDGLKQSEFFRSLLKLYIKQDPQMMVVVENIKREQKIMGNKKLKDTKNDFNSAQHLLEGLGISESDREKLFDLIEMDLGEYE